MRAAGITCSTVCVFPHGGTVPPGSIAIARATVMRPQMLLADEPTGNLDRSSGRHVMEVLEGMNADGLTLIVVTHDPAVASRANRALMMEDGRVVQHTGRGELRGPSVTAPPTGPAS